MSMCRFSTGRWLLLVLFLAICVGCGNVEKPIPRASVQGEVRWNGKAVDEGIVLFIPTTPVNGKNQPPVPAKISGGHYSLPATEGPTVGPNRIEIRATRKTGKKTPEPTEAMKRFDPTLKSVELVEQYLPPQFNNSSTLSRQVDAGSNVLDFELTNTSQR